MANPAASARRAPSKVAGKAAKRSRSASSTSTDAVEVTSAPKLPGVPHAKSKDKLVRDSFTIPKSEYAVLGSLKSRSMLLARPVKKSELLRAGIAALNAMSDKAFLSALDKVPTLATGRPKKASIDA